MFRDNTVYEVLYRAIEEWIYIEFIETIMAIQIASFWRQNNWTIKFQYFSYFIATIKC